MERVFVLKRWLLALLAVACSPPDLGTVQAEPACRAYASAICSQTHTCSPSLFELRWPDFSTCTQYTAINCINSTIAPSSGETVTSLQNCTNALQANAWECSDLYANINPPTACAPPAGSLPNGSVCAKSAQCQSGYCGADTGVTCGKCAAPPAPGTACQASAFCGLGSYCNDQNVCMAHAVANAACSSHQTCVPGYNCVSNVCTQGQPTEGAQCGVAGAATCSEIAGLDCNYQTQACAPMLIVAANQPCNSVLFGQMYSHCGGGAQCSNGFCTATAALGQPCDTAAGPFCISPARCIATNGTAGTCTITDATTCN
jgi:hypothetical protein